MTSNHIISHLLNQEEVIAETASVYYEGEFGLEIVDRLLLEVDQHTSSNDFSVKLKKKVFNVSIEVLQNLYHYFEKAHLPKEFDGGLFAIYELDNDIKIRSGNFLKNNEVNSVTSRISMINELSSEELKSLHRGVLDIGSASEQGGAGLGFIDIARKAGQNLQYSFIPIDNDYSFFILKINISI